MPCGVSRSGATLFVEVQHQWDAMIVAETLLLYHDRATWESYLEVIADPCHLLGSQSAAGSCCDVQQRTAVPH